MKPIQFEGNGFEYFKIWIVNSLLILLTLGLYYPWAKVRTKRYFYTNTLYEGRNFEYHATGKQLFLSYLIAMALLITYIFIGNILPVLSGLLGLVLFAVFPWVIWRSLQFNAKMTSFSNVRFSFNGDVGEAYLNYMLLPIALLFSFYIPIVAIGVSVYFLLPFSVIVAIIVGLVFFVLGLLLTIYLAALSKKRNIDYTVGKIQFGQKLFSVTIETKTFLRILLKTIGLGIIVFSLYAVLVFLLMSLQGFSLTDIDFENSEEIMSGDFFVMISILVYLGSFIISMLIFAYFYSQVRTYVYENTTLDDQVRFESLVRTKGFAMLLITNLLLVIITLGFAIPWTKVRTARYILENTLVDFNSDINDYLSQEIESQSSLADQLGDAFDVDVGIGL